MQTPPANSFNALRLALAIAVLLSHTPELIDGNRDRELLSRLFGTYSLGEVAVNSFFIISGFLISTSWNREPSVIAFARKRALRIAPGFFIAVAISLLIFAPIGDTNALNNIDISKTAKRLLLLMFDAQGFFGNPNTLLNGSLWTIHYEVFCYLLLAVLGLTKILKSKRVVLLLAASGLVLYIIHKSATPNILSSLSSTEASLWNRSGYYLRFTSYFLCGVALHLFHENLKITPRLLAICALSFAVLMSNNYTAPIANALPLTILLYWIGNSSSWLANKTQTADLSYGTYLYAWPIQQTIIYSFSKNILTVFLLSTSISLLAAWLSWKFIEQPALRLKQRNRY